MGDRQNREIFVRCVSRRHFLTKSDINNVRVKVGDRVIKRHENDATSISLIVSELREESFDPVLFFKPQGSKSPDNPSLSEDSLSLPYKPNFRWSCISSMHQPLSVLILHMAQISIDSS